MSQGGQALPDARVTLERWESLYQRQRREVTGEPPPVLASVTTDTDGRFRIPPPAEGFVLVSIGAPGHATIIHPMATDSFKVGGGQVALSRDEGLAMRIADAEGGAVPGARVHLVGRIVSRTWIAGRDGRVVAEVGGRSPRAAGENPFRALPPRGRTDLAPSSPFDGGESETTVTLAAARPRVLVVRREDGSPVPGVLVRVAADGEPWWQHPALTLTDEDGRATVPQPLEAPPLELHLMAEDRSWARLEIAPRENLGDGEDVGGAEDSDGEEPIFATLRPPAEVTLRVQAAGGGKPVVGALVWTTHDRTRLTGPGGELALRWPVRRLDEVGGVWGQAAASGFRPTEIRFDRALDSPRPSLDEPLLLHMRRSTSLGGRILDSEGLPVEAARVFVLPQGSSPFQLGINGPEAEATNADGRFLVHGLPAHRPFLLRVEAPGFAPAELPTPGLGEGEARRGIEFTLRPGRQAVATVLGADAAPVEGATVELSPHATGGGDLLHGPPVPCDGEGLCEVSGLSPGRFDLRVEAPGHAPSVIRGVEVPAGAGAPADLGTAYVQRAVDLAGRVMTADGTPVAGARVRALSTQEFGGRPDPLAETRSSQDGLFLLTGLAAGQRTHLVADAKGFTPSVLPALEAPATDLELSLERGAVLAGVVVDSTGEPVPRAFLRVEPMEPPTLYLGFPDLSTVSDSEGIFELTDLPAGSLKLKVSGPVAAQHRFELRPGEERRGLRIQTGETRERLRLSGRVTAADGEPIPSAWVHLQAKYGGSGLSSGTTTRADGKFEISTAIDGHRPGDLTWELHVDHPEFLEERRTLGTDSDLAAMGQWFEIVLTAGGTTVAGTVVGTDGEPLPDAVVVLERPRETPDALPGHGMPGDSESGVTGPDGSFLFQGVEPGAWELFARHPDRVDGGLGEPFTIGASPVTGLRVVLERGAILRGRVSGLEPRELATLRISATSFEHGGYDSLSGQPDYTGEFSLAGAKPGRWRVRAITSEGSCSLQKIVDVAPGDREVEVLLEFPDGFELTGTVTVNGVPRPGVRLRLYRRGDSLGAITGPDGGFRFTDVEAGDYELSTAQPSFGRELTVRGDDEIRVALETAIIAGQVVDAEGRPVKASVELIPVDAVEALRMSRSGQSEFRFEVPSGLYQLRVHASGYLPHEEEVWARPAAVDDLNLILGRGDEATLDLSADRGPPPTRVLVAVAAGPGGEQRGGWHAVGPAGRAQVSGLYRGNSRILIAAPGRATVAAEVEIPGPPVAVTLPAAAGLRVEAPSLVGAGTRVRILDAGGRPLATLSPLGRVSTRWRLVDGYVEISGLPPGRWALDIRAGDRPAHRLPVVLTAGATTEVTLP